MPMPAASSSSSSSSSSAVEIPDCYRPRDPILVRPRHDTPHHTLYLSNLDDQHFLRFTIKYLYAFRREVPTDTLVASLAEVLVHYYPLAGRLRPASGNGDKFELDCNGEGALLAEAFADGLTADKFIAGSSTPNKSWRKLLCRVDSQSFIGVPPLVVQVTRLSCGGMILCAAINHCLCDGIGSSQFLRAWALLTVNPDSALPVAPFHDRRILEPRRPPRIAFPHPEFTAPEAPPVPSQFLFSEPLLPVSLTFTSAHILRLKRRSAPSLKCTSFEVLAVHIWRAWVKSLHPPPSSQIPIKLLFSADARRRLIPELPDGYYGNGFVLACAETTARDLLASSACYGVELVQEAKARVSNEYVRSMVDLLEERRAKPDLASSLVISPWTKLGLEDVDFGEGRPLHVGPVTSEIYCLFLPVIGDLHAFTVLLSMPHGLADRFREHCKENLEDDDDGDGDREAKNWVN
ncbi:alcohol acyltransferase 9-like [Zingiber officinale]|uniref:alcohol acyltransferase 9-like n=1 Tax=Zingiber officinale TaxID=94328 RepID=UPI001C4B58F9|nr:alcohol acyltransferase 9-like [Zingiber officinale]XP_042407016.1 alcohol acyltransferase 9-like [Zingiber officinale]XP_042407017.1 alcohol acyltransferase 9-like [Zingiber officinale]XP_042407019.1 alcohol acyltransferase 9-like [Zingiber officinale]